MGQYKIITYSKVVNFINSLDTQRKARIDRIYYLFEEYGRFLDIKYLKKLTTSVWELRAGNIRLFLALKGNTGIVVHGCVKKTNKTSQRDLELALQRIKKIG